MTTDTASLSIEQLPASIATEFRDYESQHQRGMASWNPWKASRLLAASRAQLAKALDLYLELFRDWTEFYGTLDKKLSQGWTRTDEGLPVQSLNFKDEATRAIEGMPLSDVSVRAKELDGRFVSMCRPGDSTQAHEQAERVILAIETTRQIVAELAIGCAKAQADLAAAKMQAEQYTEHRRIVGQPRQLQGFLQAEFPKTWASLADGRPLVDIAEQIIRKIREGQPVL